MGNSLRAMVERINILRFTDDIKNSYEKLQEMSAKFSWLLRRYLKVRHTSLFTSAATNQRVFSKEWSREAQVLIGPGRAAAVKVGRVNGNSKLFLSNQLHRPSSLHRKYSRLPTHSQSSLFLWRPSILLDTI